MKTLKRLTHIVVKTSDLNKYIDPMAMENFSAVVSRVASSRFYDEKVASPEYIVINTDEPYIDEIVEVLKKHGCWDGWND